jgi:hypothetical protein
MMRLVRALKALFTTALGSYSRLNEKLIVRGKMTVGALLNRRAQDENPVRLPARAIASALTILMSGA